MLRVRYSPQHPPLATLCVSVLLERGLAACVPDNKLQGSLLIVQKSDNAPEEFTTDVAAAKILCALSPKTLLLYPAAVPSPSFEDACATACIDAMLSLAATLQAASSLSPKQLGSLSSHLQLRTFLCGYHLTLADLAVYAQLRRLACTEQHAGAPPAGWKDKFVHVSRWYSFLHGQQSTANAVGVALRKAGSTATRAESQKNEDGKKKAERANANPSSPTAGDKKGTASHASYEGKLEGAVQGKVVTRFPPEPSGYLHIGHAKAALLNSYFAKKYNGKMLFRFDDTNPARENEEFESSIAEDLRLLNVEWAKISHTSDYFEEMQSLCERLIKEGKFYVDDTPAEVMREQRAEGVESCRRNASVEESLQRWAEMLKGSAEGQKCCVRAKMDMQSKNKCMRDPVMYRCVADCPHHRHGDRFKAYPTYDFACPVVDSIEGVTHALRTNEYADRIPQYQWVQQAAGLAPVHIYEFSRLCFVKTLLSKRKLKQFVDTGLVEGWDDPRMPTVRGIRRRGLQVEALLEFILEQGPSKAGNLMEWDKLWTKNKQIIDPIVPRFMAVGKDAVPVFIKGGPETVESKKRRMHAKNESLGEADLLLLNKILIDRDDAAMCENGEEVTLMHWGNCIFDTVVKNAAGEVTEIQATLHLEGDFRKTKKKLHWLANLSGLSAAPAQSAELVLRELDHLITVDKLDQEEGDWEKFINPQTLFDTPAIGDPLLRQLREGDLLQLERRGYFRVDQAGDRLVLIKIPDGRSKAMSAVGTKVDAAKLSGAKITGKK
ncbi:putative glutamyl-tRNA synthetase [Neospora caninum Liverpool]|uniref:glutamate--tRNA ligase n=1 Tax=Neospora caninum (strain Liverpool) TaxID=572307 RepID=F0VFX7_NEOCL|nr:putative glutamyl-tRNA synthetase [Neospora caninum Liverpool]CBZ52621.1 putative glutamyl-tRNA synthetase [Neospora caninum Liverpool]CEL66600.1 TPA: glutamyl-tRNA synthetase, putative [Neospora caninum Liverpool]|eukprot:XP_003882653.1 putative glutamyl-tRNA synthetase [Neospora caninum Liverpool]